MKQLFNNWVKDLYLFLASLQNLDILFNTQIFELQFKTQANLFFVRVSE